MSKVKKILVSLLIIIGYFIIVISISTGLENYKFNVVTAIFIATFCISFVFCGYSFYKLMKRLKTVHKEKLKSMNLPKSPSGIHLLSTPNRIISLFKSAYSKGYLGDPEIKYLKKIHRVSILVFFAVLGGFTGFVFIILLLWALFG